MVGVVGVGVAVLVALGVVVGVTEGWVAVGVGVGVGAPHPVTRRTTASMSAIGSKNTFFIITPFFNIAELEIKVPSNIHNKTLSCQVLTTNYLYTARYP
jgi:hypothetical protein